MQSDVTVDQVVQLASGLSPLEKLQVIERLAPDLAEALTTVSSARDSSKTQAADDAYEAGYQRIPEDIGDIEALLPHLPLSTEPWE
jgi:hypothetical protein